MDVWRFTHLGRDIEIRPALRTDWLPTGPGWTTLSPTEAVSWLSEWRHVALGPALAREICREALGQPFLSIRVAEDVERLYRRLRKALQEGELVVLSIPHPIVDSDEPEKTVKEELETPPRPEPPKKTWVEFRLVRRSNGKPVVGARYRLKLTDGTTRTGALDSSGSVRVEGIDPGTCSISFLDYDQREWQRI